MRHLERLPIWRDAMRLLHELEQSVRAFSRYHKYSVGADLRATAMRLCQAIHRAHTRRQSYARMVQQVAETIDDLKLQIQLARELRAFHDFAAFQRAAELSVSVGRQAGGWLRQARADSRQAPAAARDPIHCAPASPAVQG